MRPTVQGATVEEGLTGAGGVTNLAELGTGKVLTGLAKRINPEAVATAVTTPADIDAFVADLLA